MDGSSDWSERGSRSRGSSTSLSTSGAQFDELKTAAASATAEAVNSLGEVMRKGQAATPSITAEAVHTFGDEVKEQAATASAITAMGSDVRRVVTKVDVIEEGVGAAKSCLRKQT